MQRWVQLIPHAMISLSNVIQYSILFDLPRIEWYAICYLELGVGIRHENGSLDIQSKDNTTKGGNTK